MPLSDTAIKNAKPADKPYKLQDEKGMYLLVQPNGSKYFRYNYRFAGKRKTLAVGVYPSTTLKQAREKVYTAKNMIDGGIDPAVHKQSIKAGKVGSAANSFCAIATEWGEKKSNDWSKPKSRSKSMLRLYILPYLGEITINDITPLQILECLRRIEARGIIETAYRTLNIVSQIFRYGVATGRCDRDITQDLRGALSQRKTKHFSAITEPKQVAELLRAIDGYQGSFTVYCALRLAPLLFQRPGELRAAEWEHIDLESKEWRYFVSKTQIQHIVPLSSQSVEILKGLKQLTGGGVWLFPSERNPNNTRAGRCMSENTLNSALRRLGYDKETMTSHGFRAMARTLLDEVLGFRPDFIEHQLAHSVRDPLGRAYNRTAHLPERHKMMQVWADYLDALKIGGNVVQFKRQG